MPLLASASAAYEPTPPMPKTATLARCRRGHPLRPPASPTVKSDAYLSTPMPVASVRINSYPNLSAAVCPLEDAELLHEHQHCRHTPCDRPMSPALRYRELHASAGPLQPGEAVVSPCAAHSADISLPAFALTVASVLRYRYLLRSQRDADGATGRRPHQKSTRFAECAGPP